ncbi:MAG: transcriptional regulator, winged helix family [Ilumatobacteraceae bacterium]|nr:transcriptional regulator, winged helix family [Ilumatobacteraceae bacterium]
MALVGWANEEMTTDRLVEALWGVHPPRSSVKLLQNLVLSLRKSLGRDSIETCAGGYRLRVVADAVDVVRWERLGRDGRSRAAVGDWEAASTMWSQAVALWRGRPLVELSDWPPARELAAALAEQQRTLCEDLAEAELACERHHVVVPRLLRMVDEEPLRERGWALLMLALHRCGRQAEALRAFQRVRLVLDEVGLQPGPELVDLERAVSARDGSLAVAPRESVGVSMFGVSASLGARRDNLPFELSRFVGRASEVAKIDRLIGTSRLVTLVGVGGGGKTRLALQVGANAMSRYPQGVWLLELAPISDGSRVVTELAVALSLDANGCDGVEEIGKLLCDSLAERSALLIFDNCEHLVDAIAGLVKLLLTKCSRVSVLATSREVLGVPGEVVYQVPALSLPSLDDTDMESVATSDSVALFCERARQAVPDFCLTQTNALAVARICHKLEGIPLALELAAARIRVLSAEQIVDHLEDSFGVLAGGPRTEALRHQTMQAALDWSYELLSPADQRSLGRLAVFPHRFDIDAAIAVIRSDRVPATDVEPDDGFDSVARLVAKSLLVVDNDSELPRYRLLQPIRRYAIDKLVAFGETETIRRRHRDFFLGQTERWASDTDNLLGLLADLPNYRVALEWSWAAGDVEAALQLLVTQALGWFWAGYPDTQEWIERVLAVAEPTDSRARVRALSRLALILNGSDQSDVDREQHLMLQAATMATRLGDPAVMAVTSWSWGELNVAHDELEAGRRQLEDAERQYARLRHVTGVAWCEHSLGWAAMASRDIDRARRCFERAVELARDPDAGAFLIEHSLAALSPILAASGECERGLRLADEALARARSHPVRAVLIMALVCVVETSILAGAQEQAADVLRELLVVLQDRASLRWVADTFDLTAVVIASTDPGRAVELVSCAAALRASAGSQAGGIRIIRAEVDVTRERLLAALGSQRFESHRSRGTTAVPAALLADAIAFLGTAQPVKGSVGA